MMAIDFRTPAARARWDQYFTKIRQLLSGVSARAAADLMTEIEGHAEESLNELGEATAENVEIVLERLGEPDVYLEPILTEKLLEEASHRPTPASVAAALMRVATRRIGGFFTITLLFGGYGLSFTLIVLSVLKPLFPGVIGLYVNANGIVLGGLTDATGYTEVLGNWFAPLGLALGGALYFGLSKLLSRLPAK